MDIHQLKTFVVVAREGSITRASERLHLSQPAVSAHIKAIEDAVGLTLFDRTPRGMSLTGDGQRLLAKAEQTLDAHHALMAEAARIKGQLTGKLRLGAGGGSTPAAAGHLLTALSERCPEVDVVLEHYASRHILAAIRDGSLDAGFYVEAGELDSTLTTIEVSRFSVYLASPPGLVAASSPPDWKALAEVPWICSVAGTCCWQAAEGLFKAHQFRPKQIISVDRENVTRTLIAGGVGLGLLHADTAMAARSSGEVELVYEAKQSARVLFAHLAARAQDPLLSLLRSIVRRGSSS